MGRDSRSAFERSGLAAISDLRQEEWREVFGFLEREQQRFREREGEFRSAEYRWPRDPLHEWSRVWEYPYAYEHLRTWRRGWDDKRLPVVADVGSGVTFFPFAVAHLGCEVVCADIDPVCVKDMARAAACVSAAPGCVECRLAENGRLPYHDGEASAVYCISVLEHVDGFEAMVRELGRILAPGGLCILTMDIGLRGGQHLSLDEYGEVRRRLEEVFELVQPEGTIHPLDLLTTRTSTHPLPLPGIRKYRSWLKYAYRVYVQRMPTIQAASCSLAVIGLVLRKRAMDGSDHAQGAVRRI